MARYRILRLITWLPAGGIERKIVAVLPRLDPELFEVHLCCLRERGPLAADLERVGIPVHVIPFRSRMDPIGMWRLEKLVRRLQIDLVHAHMYRANVPATLLKMGWDAPLVVGHYHNVDTWETKRQLWLDRYTAKRRDMNVAVSEAVRRDVLARLGLAEDRIRTLHNGVDLEEFKPLSEEKRGKVRAESGFADGDVLVICVARLVRAKNQELVLHSIRELVEAAPKAHFLFVGSGPDQERLERVAEDFGVDDRVRFLGRRDDVAKLLGASDVAVLPSLREGFSNAVLEALACGVPVVASDVGGNAEIIDPGINGYLCDVAAGDSAGEKSGHRSLEVNAGQFVRRLRRLLTEPELRAKMAVAARESAEGFGIDRMVADVEQLYLELLQHDGADAPQADDEEEPRWEPPPTE